MRERDAATLSPKLDQGRAKAGPFPFLLARRRPVGMPFSLSLKRLANAGSNSVRGFGAEGSR